jgi:hypothetical protein
MFKPLRHGAMAFLTLGLPSLSGCSNGHAVASAGIVKTAAPSFSLDTPVDRIAANERGKAILNRDLPGLMASSSYLLFDDMSLTEIASLSGGLLTKTKLDLVQDDLTQLSRQSP